MTISLARDANRITVLGAVSSADGVTPVALWADPVTHRLLVDSAAASGTVTDVSVVSANGFAGSVANSTTTPAITLSTTITGILQGNGTAISAVTIGSGLDFTGGTLSATGGVPTTITVANEATDTSCFIGFFTAATGDLGPKTNANLTFDSSTGVLTLGQTAVASITGNAGTATALQTARTIGGVSFDGTANITVATATGGFTVSGGALALGANDLTMTGSLAATGARVTKGWFTDIESTNMPTVGGTSLTTVAQTFQNKTITNSNNVLGGVTMTLGSDADGDMYYRASNVLTRLPKGTAGQVLTINAGATAPEWKTSSASTSTPKMISSTAFETSGRFTSTVVNGGTATFNTNGLVLSTSATGTSSASTTWRAVTNQGNGNIYLGSPEFAVTLTIGNQPATASEYYGIGEVTVGGTGHTYTDRHIGFKIITSGSTSTIYATQADGTTENASSALVTVTSNDQVDLIFKINGTSSVDYYYRKNGGSLSSATNLTSNLPSGTSIAAQFSVSNDSTATNCARNLYAASFTR